MLLRAGEMPADRRARAEALKTRIAELDAQRAALRAERDELKATFSRTGAQNALLAKLEREVDGIEKNRKALRERLRRAKDLLARQLAPIGNLRPGFSQMLWMCSNMHICASLLQICRWHRP